MHYIGQRPEYLRADLPVFFAEDADDVEVYGRAVKYQTTKSLKLLNMGDLKTVVDLMDRAKSEELKKSIGKAFRVSSGIIRRVSKIKYDIHVAVFICKLGYDGYWAPRLKGKYENTFHPEIVLCGSRDVLKVVAIEGARGPPPRNEQRGVTNDIRASVSKSVYL